MEMTSITAAFSASSGARKVSSSTTTASSSTTAMTSGSLSVIWSARSTLAAVLPPTCTVMSGTDWLRRRWTRSAVAGSPPEVDAITWTATTRPSSDGTAGPTAATPDSARAIARSGSTRGS